MDFLLRKRNILLLRFVSKGFHDSSSTKSDSQKTFYENAVSSILKSNLHFIRFRRIYNYREIVETVTYQQGQECLERITKLGPLPATDFSKFFQNDSVGMPTKFRYPQVGRISPTTLRYISIALELKKLFGENLNGGFVEIGAGYGGQAAVLMEFFQITEYGIYDLEQVQELTLKFLNQLGKSKSLSLRSLSDNSEERWDIVISNYAFSELPAELQKEYVEKVLNKSERGYLIMNSGMTNQSGRSDGKLTLEELRGILPKFEIFEEIPKTGPDNYVIAWGHNPVAG
jgi:hypothetical protein